MKVTDCKPIEDKTVWLLMCAHPRYFWKIPRTCAIVHIHLHLWNHQICYQKNVASNICDCSSIQEGTIKVFPTHFPEARSKVTACKSRRHIPKLSLSLTFPHLVNRTPRSTPSTPSWPSDCHREDFNGSQIWATRLPWRPFDQHWRLPL